MPREWEEFEPNFIDRKGELWAWWPTVRHSAGGRIRTLCRKTDNQPVRAGEVAGFDNSGRLAFNLFGVVNTLFIYTPGGAAVPEAPVIWQETTTPNVK